MTDTNKIEIEKLEPEQRALLLLALDIDRNNLKCQICNKKADYKTCCIMPAIDTNQRATILCSSMLCQSEYFTMLRKSRFMPDSTTPKCHYCGQAMKNHTPTSGRFKGQVQKHSWMCDCKRYPKGHILSVG